MAAQLAAPFVSSEQGADVVFTDSKMPCKVAWASTDPANHGYWWRLDYLYDDFKEVGEKRSMNHWVTQCFKAIVDASSLPAARGADDDELNMHFNSKQLPEKALRAHVAHTRAIAAFLLQHPVASRTMDCVALVKNKLLGMGLLCIETMTPGEQVQIPVAGMGDDDQYNGHLTVTFGGDVWGFRQYLRGQPNAHSLQGSVRTRWNQTVYAVGMQDTLNEDDQEWSIRLRDLVLFVAFAEKERKRHNFHKSPALTSLLKRLQFALIEFMSDKLDLCVRANYDTGEGMKSLPSRQTGTSGKTKIDPASVWDLSESAKRAGTSLKQALQLQNNDPANKGHLAGAQANPRGRLSVQSFLFFCLLKVNLCKLRCRNN